LEGGLWTAYDVHLGLDFLLVLIELFSLGVTAESLRAKTDQKSAISLQHGEFDGPKGSHPPVIFSQIVRPTNVLRLCCWWFSHKENF